MTQAQKYQIDDFVIQVTDFADQYGRENLEWLSQRLLTTSCIVHTVKHKDGDAYTMHTVRSDAQKSYLQTSINIFYRKSIIDEVLIDLENDSKAAYC